MNSRAFSSSRLPSLQLWKYSKNGRFWSALVEEPQRDTVLSFTVDYRPAPTKGCLSVCQIASWLPPYLPKVSKVFTQKLLC